MNRAAPRSPAAIKWAVSLCTALSIVLYLVYLRAHRGLFVESGLLGIYAGEYHFFFQLDGIFALEWLGAAFFFFYYAGRGAAGLPGNRVSRAVFFALIATALFLFLWGSWLGRIVRLGEEVLVAAVIGSLAGWLLTMPDGPGLWLARLGAAAERTPRWLIVLAGFLAGVAVCHGGWVWLHGRQTFMTDAQSQISQARLLLTGHFIYPLSQPLRDVVEIPYALVKTPSYSQFPPGYILALMPAIAAGMPGQFVCTLAGGFLVALTSVLAMRLCGRAAGWATVIMFAGSPFLWIVGGTAMNHTFCAALLMATLCCWLPLVENPGLPPSRLRVIAGGLALGWAVATRPLTGLAHGAVWGAAILVIVLVSLRRAPSDWTRILPKRVAPWAVLGLIVPAAMFMFYNARTTGHALRMAYETSNPTGHVLGFRNSGLVPYAPIDAVNHVFASIFSLNEIMLGWVIGSWVGVLVWWKRTRFGRGESILFALIVAQVFLYSLYHFFDLFIGPRFLFELLPILIILAMIGIAPSLQRGGTAAGATLLILFMLSACSIGAVLTNSNKYYSMQSNGLKMEQFMASIEPLKRPTVVLITAPYNELVGRWYPAIGNEPPVYFVLKSKEAKARALPELKGFDWVEMK
ncbi:hypothetical protein LLG95_05210 [bacterium]|nr:hypothetical protein [bacterium]